MSGAELRTHLASENLIRASCRVLALHKIICLHTLKTAVMNLPNVQVIRRKKVCNREMYLICDTNLGIQTII